jgi:GT2 family glycosyltransferase
MSILISVCVVTTDERVKNLDRLKKSLDDVLWWPDTHEVIVKSNDSIALGYNEAASEADGQYLFFVHDDVELRGHRPLLFSMLELLKKEKTGLVGMAGTRVFPKNGVWWEDKSSLSGAVYHTANGNTWDTSFGVFGRVVVLDGVFLSIERKKFEEIGGFPITMTGFDFYDLAICMEARKKGYDNYTFPFPILHHSLGDVTNREGWHENRTKFLELYNG